MTNKFVLTIAAGAMAFSAAAATSSYKVSLLQNSTVEGKQVKAGDYRVEVKDNNTVVLKHGKQVVELPAREETAPAKFNTTEIQYSNNNDLQEIHIGGTNTKIVFTNATGAGE